MDSYLVLKLRCGVARRLRWGIKFRCVALRMENEDMW